MFKRPKAKHLAKVELDSVVRIPGGSVGPHGLEICFADGVDLYFEGLNGKEKIRVSTIPCFFRPDQPEGYRVSIYPDGIRKLDRAIGRRRRWINPDTGNDVARGVCKAVEKEIQRVNKIQEEWNKLSPAKQQESMNRMLELTRQLRGR